ncbi:MAG: S-methyl-5'-thioadenosine phosphorylase [Candidatus Omnitrophota bacterium]|jgi:5'-methylthioadenosine phosphorylase
MSKIGVIGGSGLYDIEEFEHKKRLRLDTPFGNPSDEFILAKCKGKDIVFLSRHARGHKLSPSQINYRANIYGMKSLGVERIISLTACGSLKQEYKPLDFVIPEQFVDRTNQARNYTFFDQGITAHINFAHPICNDLAGVLYQAAKRVGVSVHFGGIYLNMEGPQFSTLAESNLYRSWGMDIIGMTNMTEARLAREAEMCYATLAAVTDYDCWHESHTSVTVEMILDNLKKNVENSKRILTETITQIGDQQTCSCQHALKYSIVTAPESIPKQAKKRLRIIIGKYIKQ